MYRYQRGKPQAIVIDNNMDDYGEVADITEEHIGHWVEVSGVIDSVPNQMMTGKLMAIRSEQGTRVLTVGEQSRTDVHVEESNLAKVYETVKEL